MSDENSGLSGMSGSPHLPDLHANDPSSGAAIENPPIGGREMIAVGLWTFFADVFIFRSFGYTGPAMFLATVPLIFWALFPVMMRRTSAKWTVAILAIVVFRLVWSGSWLAVFSGFLLTVATAMVAAGAVPTVLEGLAMAARAMFDGMISVGKFHLSKHLGREGRLPGGAISILLPIAATTVFGTIFVFANPDLLDGASGLFFDLTTQIMDWLTGFSIWEIPFCVVALLVGAGLMRPALPLAHFGSVESSVVRSTSEAPSPWYAAFRNTLITVIALFVVYLGFEWATLWKRDFPVGFYYAGYAHQGAAWLTFALALATGMLSLVFRGSILSDPRIESLRKLAWIWSGLNLLLAVAVYHRLLIYVGYNGMTRMRTVGFFGITLVVIGFVLVLYKIGKSRNFWWLIRTQLIAFALTVIAYSVFPVDYVANSYNVSRVSSGYLPPSVMIAVKPIGDEGITPLLGLLDCPDKTIRRGVLAMLAQRQVTITYDKHVHWTEFQISRNWLQKKLAEKEQAWASLSSEQERIDAIKEFRTYAMQWY